MTNQASGVATDSGQPGSGEAQQTLHARPGGWLGRLGGYLAEGIRFWEPMRLVYNLVLVLVVVGDFFAAEPGARDKLSFNLLLALIFFAVLANICYCAAYIPDFFVQFSGLKAAWRWGRVVLLTIGILFAAIISHFFAIAFFSAG